MSPHKCQGRAAWIGGGGPICFCEKSSAPVIAEKKNLIPLFDVDSSILPFLREADCLPAGSCMSGNVHVRLREKGGGQKWPCCTSLSSSMGSALFFLGEYANMILMRCGALHLTFVGLPSSGACVPAFLCNKPLRPKTSGRWSRGAFGEG